jgi:putative lipoic acid-binding regulatory protein
MDLITRRAIGLPHAQRPSQFTLPLCGDAMASFEDQIVRLRIRKDKLHTYGQDGPAR